MIRKTTWVIVLIFALLLATAFFWQRSQDEKTAEATPEVSETSEEQYLFNIEGEVASLRIEHVGQNAIELVRDANNQWTLAGSDEPAPDSAAVDDVVSQLGLIPLVSTLQNVPELQDLGLEPPVYRILVVTKDGKQLVASIGKITPTGSGYYVLSGDRRVYIANEFSLQPVLDLVDKPLPTPLPTSADETPGVEPANPPATSVP